MRYGPFFDFTCKLAGITILIWGNNGGTCFTKLVIHCLKKKPDYGTCLPRLV